MKMTKKFAAIVVSVLSVSAVFAQTRTIKIASVAPARSSWDVQQRTIAKEWAEITNGEISLQFMNADAMGGEAGVVKKLNSVRPGQKAPIGGAIFTSLGVSNLEPRSNVMTLCAPFLFRNQNELNAVLTKFTPEMQQPLLEKGYVVLGWFNVGWAYFFTSEPAKTPADLKKLKLAVGGLTSPALANAFKSAGFLTQNVPADKYMSAITNGDIQGLFTIPMYAYAAGYCKTLDNVINIPLAPVMVTMVMSKEEWDSIPDKYKPALMESIKRAEATFVRDQKRNDANYLARCKQQGCVSFDPTPAERQLWEDQFKKDMPHMYSGSNPVVSKALYDKIAAYLKSYRGE
ncbi:MAG: TRAP transporter substrate-binding protein DctP [Treponema sp.]|nr:TRAP transporter substrate-binding protein DctP [Treponema sp.]